MRNLKRALSLLLSSTMVLGMVVMGGSAVGYQDVDASNNNQEAIEVLQAVGIMTGVDDKGNFNPDGGITRNEMAVVMAHLLNLDYDYYRGTNPFTDVPEWAAPYVAACAAEGVVAGIGDGKFGGDNAVTAAQASLMIMKALGYFQNQEDFGEDWQIATIRQASYINMFDKVDSTAESALTRGQVAQLVLNGLKSDMVSFTGDKGVQIGDVTVGYHAEYTSKTNAAVKYNSINTGKTDIAGNNQYYIQLGEELYNGDLRLSPSTDEFGRPTNKWEYLNDKVGNYVRSELLLKEYTSEVTGRDLYELLNSYIVANDKLTVYIDGVSDASRNSAIFGSNNLIKSNTKAIGGTGNGVLTQVYRDASAGEITVSIINTYLAKATDDFDAENDTLDVNVYGYKTAGNANIKDTTLNASGDAVISKMKADNEDVAVSNYVDGDIMMVRVSDGQIAEVMDPEILSNSTLTAFSLTKNTITSDGTTYNQADTRLYDVGVLDAYSSPENLKDLTYNIILDPYGYYIGLERNEDPDQYVFITGYEPYVKNLTTAVADAGAIFVDGTMETIDVKVKDSMNWDPDGDPVLNTWYTYSVNDAGEYTLSEVVKATDNTTPFAGAHANDDAAQFAWSYTGADKDIDKNNISLPAWAATAGDTEGPDASASFGGMVYGNADSVYLTVDTQYLTNTSIGAATIIDDVQSVTTGVKNANLVVTEHAVGLNRTTTSAGVYTLYSDKGTIIASIVVGEDAAASTNYVFVSSSDANLETYGAKTRAAEESTHTWTREVIINGELKELVYTGDTIDYIGATGDHTMVQGNIYKVSFNANGEVTDTDLIVNMSAGDKITEDGQQIVDNITDTQGNDDVVLMALDLLGSSNTLRTEGWSMYISDGYTEGFALADDAKAVLIERVNGVAYDEVTYFDSKDNNVKDAIDALYEGHNSDNFDGMVYAIFEDGIATSVIIVDNVSRPGVNDGGDPNIDGDLETILTGSALDLTSASVASNGRLTARFAYTAPAFAATGATVSMDLDVYANGEWYDTITATGTVGANGKATVQYRSSSSGEFPTNEALTFDVVDESVSEVKIKLVTSNSDVEADVASLTVGTPTTVTLDIASANESKYSGGQFTVASVTGATTAALPGAANHNATATISNVNASGTDYVTITVTDTLALKPVTYTAGGFTAANLNAAPWNISGETTMTLAVTPVMTTGIAPGTRVDFKVTTASGIGAAANEGYLVEIEKLGFSHVFTGNDTQTATVAVNSNITIAKEDVEVTPIAKFAVVSGAGNTYWSEDGRSIIVTFNQNIDETTATTTNVTENGSTDDFNDSVDIDSISVNGKVMTITLKNGALDGTKGKVTISANVKDEYGCALAATTLTIGSTGVITVAP